MISKQKPTPGVHLQKKQAHEAINSAPGNNSRQNEYSQWRLQCGTVSANCNANFIEPGANYDRKGVFSDLCGMLVSHPQGSFNFFYLA